MDNLIDSLLFKLKTASREGGYKSLSYCVTLKECNHAFSFVYVRGRNRTRSWRYTFTHAVQKAEMQTGMASKLYTWPEKERFNIKKSRRKLHGWMDKYKNNKKKKKSKLQPRRSRVTNPASGLEKVGFKKRC